jgi:sphinganine-1-phosphate aldolase
LVANLMSMKNSTSFPVNGTPGQLVLREMKDIKSNDASWKEGRMFGYIYYPGEDLAGPIEEAYRMFMTDNALNPSFFRSLRKFESEVVAMIADLLHAGPEAAGSMTSGGTESILMAVKSARDKAIACRPMIRKPEMIIPSSAHPAFHKAAHYLGVTVKCTAVRADKRADSDAIRNAISPDTILLVASAPCYPHGVVDPVAEIGELAVKHDLPFHVDACVGGMMLPFLSELGYQVPLFDFRVPGVTSVSVDIHKYGYSSKGSSVIIYKNHELRRHQFFVYTEWSGGLYGSPTTLGTRSGGPIAAAWATIMLIGRDGYRKIAEQVMNASVKLRNEINSIPHLRVVSNPEMSMFAFTSDELDIFEIGDALSEKGWHLDRIQHPDCLHLIISNQNVNQVDNFILALRDSVDSVKNHRFRSYSSHLLISLVNGLARMLPDDLVRKISAHAAGNEKPGKHSMNAAMYGITGSLEKRGNLKDLVLDVLDRLY